MLPTTQALWMDKAQAIISCTTQMIPQVDAHDIVVAASTWAEQKDTNDGGSQQPSQEQLTEEIVCDTAVAAVSDFMWQHTTLSHHDRPDAVLYEVVGNQEGDLLPCREWVYAGQNNTSYKFVLAKDGGLQPRTRCPWGPPVAELFKVSAHLMCATCIPGITKLSAKCRHKKVYIDKSFCPMHSNCLANINLQDQL
jgi:hypothetical protein